VHRAEHRDPGPGQRGQVLIGHRARDDLADRVGDPAGQGRTGNGGGQRLEGIRPLLVDPGQAVHERVVQAVDQRERLIGAGRPGPQGVGEHQRTAPAAGNHCSSGSGSVLGDSSR
jgi:hypothetical protein